MEDLWELNDENKTEGVIKRFLPNYEAEVKSKKNRPSKNKNEDGTPILENQTNILVPLFKTFGWNLLGIAFIKLVTSLLAFVSPTVLNALITFVSSKGDQSKTSVIESTNSRLLRIVVDGAERVAIQSCGIPLVQWRSFRDSTFLTSDPLWKGVFLASIMLFSAMVESILTSQYEYRIYRIAMRVRSAVTYAVYCKALKLSSQAKGQFTTGEIVTLMSVDSQRY